MIQEENVDELTLVCMHGCSLTTFGVGGSQVCGKALAYCLGHSHAFLGYHYRERYTLGGYNVDGLLTSHEGTCSRCDVLPGYYYC